MELHVVTGAFGYSGSRIARRLLDGGHAVRTLTNAPGAGHPLRDRIEVRPYSFDTMDTLTKSLQGARVLYNTYWVRFNHPGFDFATAIRNSGRLFEAAQWAGVERVVHVSITNPSLDSPFEYFRGKAQVEELLRGLGISHAILRPAVFFGEGDILVNNIAWTLRHLPVFGLVGRGDYGIQPIHVEDFADVAVEAGRETTNTVSDAIGPESFTYRGLVETLADAIGVRRPIVSVPIGVALGVGNALGRILHDVVVTRDELEGLAAGLLATSSPPRGRIRLSAWAREHAAELGRRWSSELGRRMVPTKRSVA